MVGGSDMIVGVPKVTPAGYARRVRIDIDFEGGRIETLGISRSSVGGAPHSRAPLIRLSIPPDPKSPRFRQWFQFALVGARGRGASFKIVNAGDCTWAKGFTLDYAVFATDDGEAWQPIPTKFDGKVLSFRYTPTSDRSVFAYFPPFTRARTEALVALAVKAGELALQAAVTNLGAPVPLLAMGRKDRRAPALWVIAQQHPGEPMAGWFMEGFVTRLCGRDPVARSLLETASVLLVPRMNPDGCALGNHRTNAEGIDLNRQWADPEARAPEVRGVRTAMAERGVDVFLDIHGDEVIPHVFAHGTAGIPHRTAVHEARERRFAAAMLEATPDFQTEHGYPKERKGAATMGIAANYIAEQHGALAITLEMPYRWKHGPRAKRPAWTPERARRLGEDTVAALASSVSGMPATRR
jgi:murein tripeptide amidase MpaA